MSFTLLLLILLISSNFSAVECKPSLPTRVEQEKDVDIHHLRHRRRGLHGLHASHSNDDNIDEKNKKSKEDENFFTKESNIETTTILPKYLKNHLGNITVPFHQSTDIPLFLHIPKSGGTLAKHHYGKCLNLVESTQRGAELNHEKALKVVTDPITSMKYVNVDTTHVDGIEEASYLRVASSHLADIIFTSYLYESLTELFDILHQGRLFLLLRNPIEREVSLFYYRQKASWEKNTYNPAFQNITIEEYASKGLGTSNPLLRMLTKENGDNVPLTRDDLNIAKLLLKQKCLIGLTNRMTESIVNFDRYFGWYDENDDATNQCRKKLGEHGLNKNAHQSLKEGSDAWNLLYKRNELDMELYEFALELYEEQRERLQMGALSLQR